MVAVSIPENEILWSSAGLPGIANGSPVVYVNQWDSKNYVVLTHNSKLVKPDNSTLTTGHATVLRMDKGHLVRLHLPLMFYDCFTTLDCLNSNRMVFHWSNLPALD